MVERIIDVSANPVLMEDEVRDTIRFTRGIYSLSGDEQAVNYPLRVHLARAGELVATVVTFTGMGYGIVAAPHDVRGMTAGITAAALACIFAMGLKSYADRQLPAWKG